METIKVKNHKDWAMTDYEQFTANGTDLLGTILFKENEIGVVIQLHSDGDIRVDFWGNCCLNECQIATMEQILSIRPQVLETGPFSEKKEDENEDEDEGNVDINDFSWRNL